MAITIEQTLLDVMPNRYTQEYNADPSRINRFIERAKTHVNQNVFGEKYSEGVALYAAHKLALKDEIVARNGMGGMIESRTVDNASYKFTNKSNQSPNGETTFGRDFDAMVDELLITPGGIHDNC